MIDDDKSEDVGQPHPGRPSCARPRRGFLKLGLSASAAALLSAAGMRAGLAAPPLRMCVFVPTDMRAHAFQKLLADALPGTDVLAFGRFRDFENVLEEKPDAVLSLEPVLRAMGLSITLAGTNHGSRIDPYVLMTAGKEPDPRGVEGVGVVDILGRQGMKELVSVILGTSPRVERVTKLEDLLTLLQVGSAEAVLLPERLVSSMRSRSKLDLRVKRLTGGVGLPCLSVMRQPVGSLIEGVQKFAPLTNQEMGVTTWESV